MGQQNIRLEGWRFRVFIRILLPFAKTQSADTTNSGAMICTVFWP